MVTIHPQGRRHYVYRITNLHDGRIYVGVHFGEVNDAYVGSSRALQRDVRLLGREHFRKDVLVITESAEDAYGYERHIVNEQFVARQDTYNVKLGGDIRPSTPRGPLSLEHRLRIRQTKLKGRAPKRTRIAGW